MKIFFEGSIEGIELNIGSDKQLKEVEDHGSSAVSFNQTAAISAYPLGLDC